MRTTNILTTLLLMTVAAGGWAQDNSQVPVPCTSELYKQFDFWVGDWEVYSNADGELQGLDTIAKQNDGCLIVQHWRQQNDAFKPTGAVNRLEGRSVTMFDTETWRQVWTDNGGTFMPMKGGLVDGNMVLTSEFSNPTWPIYKWHWEPKADGTIHNFGFVSTDRGETWNQYFDITYRPRRHGSDDSPS